MQPRRQRILACVLCVLVLAACGSQATPSPSVDSTPVARVGGDTITRGLFDARLLSATTAIQQAGGPAGQNSAMQAQLRASVLRSLILDTIIAQEAAQAGVAATSSEISAEVSAAAQQAGSLAALQTSLAQAGGSITQFRDEIRSHMNEQRLEDLFASQRAQLVENQLAAGVSLASLVASMSDDTGTNAKGGDLGALTAATLDTGDQDFAKAVRSLSVGAYTRAAVHDSGGYDIILLYAKAAASWSVRHILVAAPTPYTVKDRPEWFTGALFSAVTQYCQRNEIRVFISDAGANPCAGAPTLVPSPSGG